MASSLAGLAMLAGGLAIPIVDVDAQGAPELLPATSAPTPSVTTPAMPTTAPAPLPGLRIAETTPTPLALFGLTIPNSTDPGTSAAVPAAGTAPSTSAAVPAAGGPPAPAATPVPASADPRPTRATILARAARWVDDAVPYSQARFHTDAGGTYRQDCSGFVSMAWNLGTSATTSTLPDHASRITYDELAPGDMLLRPGSHATLFVGWADTAHSRLVFDEEPHSGLTARQNQRDRDRMQSSGFIAYRFDGVQPGPAPDPAAQAAPNGAPGAPTPVASPITP